MSTAALPTHLHLDNCAATCSHGMWSTGAVKKWRFNNALREVDRKGSNAKKWVRGVLKEWLDVLVCGSGEYNRTGVWNGGYSNTIVWQSCTLRKIDVEVQASAGCGRVRQKGAAPLWYDALGKTDSWSSQRTHHSAGMR